MEISIGENYDVGDVLAGIPTTFGIASLTGVGAGSLYGVSLSDTFALGSQVVPLSVILLIVGVAISFITNDGLSLKSLFNRPKWEVGAALSTMALPVASVLSTDVASFISQDYFYGSAFAFLLLIGYLIVGFRSENSKKVGLKERLNI